MSSIHFAKKGNATDGYRFKRATLIVVLALSCLPLWGATRRALVIGIGHYSDPAWSTIHGDNDVIIVKEMLTLCGYTDIATFTNESATKLAITTAFGNLCRRCNRGDIVYIHFSGHGQQITDVDGDEDDGWDEAWIPYDARHAYSDTYKGEKHLTDDEIAIWMTRINQRIGTSGRLLLVVDACHSGDSSRNDNGEGVCIRGASTDFIIPLDTVPRRAAKLPENWLTLTACRDYQVNYEVRTSEGHYYGMLSYVLNYAYRQFKSIDNPAITSQLQQLADSMRGPMPQDITLTGLTSTVSLSSFFK